MSSISSSPDHRSVEVPKVVIPSKRHWKGWVSLPEDEPVALPALGMESKVTFDNVLPPEAKRNRRSSERPRPHPTMEMTQIPTNRALTPSSQSSSRGTPRHGRKNPTRVGIRGRSQQVDRLRQEILTLKTENTLRAVAESREIESLRAEVDRLEGLKNDLNSKIFNFSLATTTQNPSAAGSPPDNSMAHDNQLSPTDEMSLKDQHIRRQDAIIQNLELQLKQAHQLNNLLTKPEGKEPSVISLNARACMEEIETGILYAASLLSSCLRSLEPETHKQFIVHPELDEMVSKIIGGFQVLYSAPALALRALLFHIIRERIIYSDYWTAFHFEGCMLRGYQRAIQRGSSPDFPERFHRAALSSILEEGSEFDSTVLPAHVEQLTGYIIEILAPLLDPAAIGPVTGDDLQRLLGDLLTEAFRFRARCFPPSGTRYEMIQFSPGDTFDPGLMEAQDASCNRVSVRDDGAVRKVRLCVQGAIRAYRVREEVEGWRRIKALSQWFGSAGKCVRADGDGDGGGLVSGKAVVILEDE